MTHGPVRLAGGGGRHQHPWPAVVRHPVLGRRLRVYAPALGPAAAGRGDRAGHRAGEARAAAGLVHRAEGRHLRVGDAALSRDARASTCRTGCRRCRPTRASRASSGWATCRRRWSGCGQAGLRDFYEGEVAAAVAADVAGAGRRAVAEDLRDCQARTWPAEEVGWRGRTLQLTGGLTAAPTLARVLEGMADAPYGGNAPSPAWYAHAGPRAEGGLCRTAGRSGRGRAAGGGELHHAPDRLRRRGQHGGDDHARCCPRWAAACVLPQSGVLLNNGVMWFDPRPGAPNSIAPGKRPLTQHAADHPGGERPALPSPAAPQAGGASWPPCSSS